jgi:SpoVK/Ycf46/Vps4 family AAA+-type ATPase
VSSPANLLLESTPLRGLDELVLPATVRRTVDELIEEHFRRDLLRSFGLEPRHRVLLTGPPGSGKTSLAEAIASTLMIPLLSVRYEGLIGSFLGETASRLDRLFEHARGQQCVLFFDEFDTVAKERGDTHETGEIKRVVSSLLLQVDQLPSHVLVIAATNHKELLDRAVWRRMQLRLSLPAATRATMIRWLDMHISRTGRGLGLAPRTIADAMKGASLAEVEELAWDIERRAILEGHDVPLQQIARSRLAQWASRSRSTDSE